MKFALLFVLGLAAINLPVLAAETRMFERFNVGDFIKIGPTTPHKFVPHEIPHNLPSMSESLLNQRGNLTAIRQAKAYMTKFPATTGMLLIDQGKIVFEAYQGMGRADSEFYGMSISKNLTALAIGKAYCNGVLKSLDAVAGDFVPELKINQYGESTLRQILTMSSGAYKTIFGGRPKYEGGLGFNKKSSKPYSGPAWPLRLGQITLSDLLWGQGWTKTAHKNHAKPGAFFHYRNGEPMVLSKLLERAAGESLASYFGKHVWQEVRAAQSAHWEADKEGSTTAMTGFQASLQDWGRLALWVLEERQKPGCFGDYLRQATSTQISTKYPDGTAHSVFKGYGFYWWTEHKNAPGIWGKGFAGQDLAINPETGKVLIKFSYRSYEGVASGIVKLFREWNKAL